MKSIKGNLKLKFVQLLGTLTLTTLLTGCFMPSSTYSKGVVFVQAAQENIQPIKEDLPERFIIISFWEYPIVNQSQGKVDINEVILLENKQTIIVNFPRKVYWIGWSPALGTQHLAPEPGIMIFHKSFPLLWSVGGTDSEHRICCEKPKTEHKFEFINFQETILQNQENTFGTKKLFKEFLSEKTTLIKKMEQCKGITAEEKIMVLEKLDQMKNNL